MTKIQVDIDLEEILPTFLQNRKNDVALFTEYINSKNITAIMKLGHKIAGSSGGYGFTELGLIAKEIEITAEAGNNLSKIEELINKYTEYLKNIEIEYIEVE